MTVIAPHPPPRGLCFALPGAAPAAPVAPVRLSRPRAQALADILPILGCGEESAALAFDALARHRGPAADALARIAFEERGHEALLAGLRRRLPEPRDLTGARVMARRFYLRLQERDPVRHLARISALDSAACTILAALNREGRGVSPDRRLGQAFRRIHREEVGHVRLGLALSAGLGSQRLGLQEETRAGLAELLAPFADRFEALGVDPGPLLRKIADVPGALRGD